MAIDRPGIGVTGAIEPTCIMRRNGGPEPEGTIDVHAEFLGGQKAEADVDDSLGIRLLADVRSLWPPGERNVLGRDLLEGLKMIEDAPWAEEIPSNARKLAWMLRPFGINSGSVRIGESTGKGYRLEDFEAAFSRYLSSETSQASQPA